MGLRRLRGRLDALQADAQDTMAVARDVMEDFRDGFYIELEFKGKKVPVRIRIIADEEAAQLSDGANDPTLDVILSKVAELFGK